MRKKVEGREEYESCLFLYIYRVTQIKVCYFKWL